MATTLLAVIFALLAGHAAPDLARLRQFGWFAGWGYWLAERLPAERSGPWRLLLWFALPVLLVGLLGWLLAPVAYGLAGFAYSVLIVAYCWGPRDLDQDVQGVLASAHPDARANAERRLRAELPDPRGSLAEAAFYAAIRRWFGVLFWFLLLGPAGALLFRLVQLACGPRMPEQALTTREQELLAGLRQVLEWPLVQLLALSLALVSDFDRVRSAWAAYYAQPGRGLWSLDTGVLSAVARAAVDADEADGDGFDPPDEQPGKLEDLRHALHLCWRALFAWLTLLALVVIVGFVS